MNQVLTYLPDVIAANLVFAVAAVIAGAVAGGLARVVGDTPAARS